MTTPKEIIRLKALIKSEDLTTKEFAEKLNVGESAINNILRGRNYPGYDLLQRIATVFNASVDFLMFGDGGLYRVSGEYPSKDIVLTTEKERQLIYKKNVARYLYVERFLSANHVAKEIGVSQTSVSKWVKKLNWNEEREKLITNGMKMQTYLDGAPQSIEEFKVFAQIKQPEHFELVQAILNDYLNHKRTL